MCGGACVGSFAALCRAGASRACDAGDRSSTHTNTMERILPRASPDAESPSRAREERLLAEAEYKAREREDAAEEAAAGARARAVPPPPRASRC